MANNAAGTRRVDRPALDDLVSMAVFGQVAALGSFTAAARALGLSKSAVSERVARLEGRMGVRLLVRSTRRLALTEEGRGLYERCSQLLQEVQEARDSAASGAQELRGTLRLSAAGWFSRRELAPLVARFVQAHPRLTVSLLVDDRLVDLLSGEFDCAIRMTHRLGPQLIARKLGEDRLVMCAAPAYLTERGRPRGAGDLRGHRCLRYGLATAQEEWGAAEADEAPGLVSNDGEVLLAAAVAGLGLAMLPRRLAQADLAAGRLELVLERREPALGIYAVYPDRQIPQRLRRFLDFLTDQLSGG